ncbi:MAG TPA: emp24/gp25L/p24 family protein [Blastocatellia bacterium]|nr:emp24/gp25L/p24 family protein [Blastocatellia bacterium]
MPDNNADPGNPGKRVGKGVIALAILGVCAVVLVAFAVLPEKLKDRSQRQTAVTGAPVLYSTSLPTPTPTPTPKPTPFWKAESYEIDTKAISVQRNQMWWQPLQVKNDWRNARLIGRFTAQGGEKNDIEAVVTDENGLINLRKNQLYQPKVWYMSGRVTEDAINAPLPAGQSYLIFDNRFSVSAQKTVRFELRVEYERLEQP